MTTDKNTNIIIAREYRAKQTVGDGGVYVDNKLQFAFKSLELPWKNNQKGVSCIPEGTYDIVKRWSPSFKTMLFEIKDVEGRSDCLIHNANFTYQLRGCIAVGLTLLHIDKDDLLDVNDSKIALRNIMRILPSKSKLIIL